MLIELIVFCIVFIANYFLLCEIEFRMWNDWFEGKNSWWNILYKNR